MKKIIVAFLVMFAFSSCFPSLQSELASINEQCPVTLANGNVFHGVEVEGDYVVAVYLVDDDELAMLSEDKAASIDFSNPNIVELCHLLCKNDKGLKVRYLGKVSNLSVEHVFDVNELAGKSI